MPYLSLGVLGLGIDGGEEWAVFSSRVAVGIRDIASWGLSSCPPESGSGRTPCGLMGGVSTSLGGLVPQLLSTAVQGATRLCWLHYV